MVHQKHLIIAALTFFAGHTVAQAQGSQKPMASFETETPADNGTDPTKMSSTVAVQSEHTALRGGDSLSTMKLSYSVPLGEKRNTSLRLRLPISRVDAPGVSNNFGLGDASVQLTRVFGLTADHGYVVQGEWVFDTARRAELGTGKSVIKGTLVYVMFLDGGQIFAPALVHSRSVAGHANRTPVNATTFDFYYVPKLADTKTFVTLDPALSFDWENGKRYPSLAVTVGRALGPALGGNTQVFVKPTVFAGRDRPGNWGLEVGFKVIGF